MFKTLFGNTEKQNIATLRESVTTSLGAIVSIGKVIFAIDAKRDDKADSLAKYLGAAFDDSKSIPKNAYQVAVACALVAVNDESTETGGGYVSEEHFDKCPLRWMMAASKVINLCAEQVEAGTMTAAEAATKRERVCDIFRTHPRNGEAQLKMIAGGIEPADKHKEKGDGEGDGADGEQGAEKLEGVALGFALLDKAGTVFASAVMSEPECQAAYDKAFLLGKLLNEKLAQAAMREPVVMKPAAEAKPLSKRAAKRAAAALQAAA